MNVVRRAMDDERCPRRLRASAHALRNHQSLDVHPDRSQEIGGCPEYLPNIPLVSPGFHILDAVSWRWYGPTLVADVSRLYAVAAGAHIRIPHEAPKARHRRGSSNIAQTRCLRWYILLHPTTPLPLLLLWANVAHIPCFDPPSESDGTAPSCVEYRPGGAGVKRVQARSRLRLRLRCRNRPRLRLRLRLRYETDGGSRPAGLGLPRSVVRHGRFGHGRRT